MYYRQPRYFNDFHCVGGRCENTCCGGWRIDWYQKEVDKVKDAPNCSVRLRELCEKSFEKVEGEKDKYSIILVNDRCPFLTEDNFCAIQRELGAEYLSYTCANYPRKYLLTDNLLYRSCHMTCQEVMRSLLNNEKAMDLINLPLKEAEVTVPYNCYTEEERQKSGVGHHSKILEFFYEIISDKKRNIEDSLVLGALAAQSLSKLVEQKKTDQIPETLNSLKAQMHNAAQLRSIQNIKPNYNIKLGIGAQMLQAIYKMARRADTSLSLIDESGKFNIDYYLAGEKLLEKFFEEKPFVLRNIALELLFELEVPFKNKGFSIYENYVVYVIAFAMFKLNTIAVAKLQNQVDNERRGKFDMAKLLIKSGAIISRMLCQSEQIDAMIITILKGNNMLSPAYLSLFIK